MFRNLIFDWSGTLVDDLGPVIEATNAVLGKYEIAALDRESFRRAFRLPYREFYAELLPDVSLEELEAHFRPAFDAAVTPVTVLPHAREKLEWCSALGIRAFVLTSMDTLAFERQISPCPTSASSAGYSTAAAAFPAPSPPSAHSSMMEMATS